jgi:DNA gyrase subunit A
VQAKAHIEELDRSRNRIIITELPYQVNKTTLIERIAELVRDKKLEGITDLRDESDRQGLRIVIDLTRTVDPYEVLGQLYKHTPMRTTFSIIMLALVDGEPRMLSLKQALRVYLEHRFVVVRRRTEFDLERARDRAHILEGYLTALENLDEVIALIRKSRAVENAREGLQKRFKLSEIQAQAILDMPLRRLAALERKKIEDEFKEKRELIRYLEKLLNDPKLMRTVIKDELVLIREQYGDPRRTLIVDSAVSDAVTVTDLLPDEEVWVVVTESGLVSRTFDNDLPRITTAVKDPPCQIVSAQSNDILYLFASDGMAASIPVHQLTALQDFQDGVHFASLTSLDRDQEIVAAIPLSSSSREGFLFMTSVAGMVKRVSVDDLPGASAHAFQVMILNGDALGWVEWTPGENEVLMVSAEGLAIRFNEEDVRPMGLRAAGVKGMKLGGRQDRVVGMIKIEPRDNNLWVITADGVAKSSLIADYPVQGRYGQGVITIKFRDKSQHLAAAAAGSLDDNLVVVTNKSKPKYMRLGLAPRVGRNVPGDSVIALGATERVVRAVMPKKPVNRG